MLKILQARFQQYVNCEIPDVQDGFRKGREIRNQIANIHWIIKKVREFQKNIYFCLIYYAKGFDCVDYHKLWKIIKVMALPDHLTCLLRKLYAGQEATLRTWHGPTHWFQIRKGVCQSYMLSPCLLISPCYSLELCIQMGISFFFSFAFCFSSFHRYLQGLLRQPFCFFAFLFHGDGLDPCLLYKVTNFRP